MLNLSKNVIKLLSTHPVVGIEPVWILSQIFIKSVKFTKLLMTSIDKIVPNTCNAFALRSSAADASLLFMVIL